VPRVRTVLETDIKRKIPDSKRISQRMVGKSSPPLQNEEEKNFARVAGPKPFSKSQHKKNRLRPANGCPRSSIPAPNFSIGIYAPTK